MRICFSYLMNEGIEGCYLIKGHPCIAMDHLRKKIVAALPKIGGNALIIV